MTEPLTTKAAEIRAGLVGVTTGPWYFAPGHGDRVLGMFGTCNVRIVCEMYSRGVTDVRRDLAHIGRLDPATVLAFLDERDHNLALIEQQAAELAAMKLSESDAWLQANNGHARAEAAESERDELLREKERQTRQLRALATALHTKHYGDAPAWQPFDDAEGLLSQIDNMTTGLSRAAPSALENGPAGLADAHSKSPAPSSQSERIAVLEAALRAEREACAQIADMHADCNPVWWIAEAIRARAAPGCQPTAPYSPRNSAKVDKGLHHDRENCLPPDDHRVPDAAHAALTSAPLGEE